MQMKSSNIKKLLNESLRKPKLKEVCKELVAENDPYEIAETELEEEFQVLEEKSREIGKKLDITLTLYQLKKIDSIIDKLINGDISNNLGDPTLDD